MPKHIQYGGPQNTDSLTFQFDGRENMKIFRVIRQRSKTKKISYEKQRRK